MEQYYSSLINKPPPPNFVYSFEVPFLCNICLLIYIIYRLKTREWNFNKAGTRILCMIALGLAARCSYEGELIYYYYATGNVYIPYHFEGEIFYILDNLPLLLLITIECIFVRSWYQLYLGFSNPETAFEKYQKFRFILPVSNILVYLAFIILLIALHLWQYVFYLVASQAMLCMSFLTLTGLVVFTGMKLEKQAIELADLTQVISWNSSRFKYIRVVLVICCFNKLFQLGGDLIAEVNGYARLNGLMQEDQNASEFVKELVYVLYTIFSYVGETGSFLCLISLLNVFQKNTKAPLCSNIFAIQ